MLLLHDIVEIDAGDTFVYDTKAAEVQYQNELQAAERLFGMLPEEQCQQLMETWLEFERAESSEAQFAKALDRLLPMLLNSHNEGQSWVENGVKRGNRFIHAAHLNQKTAVCGTVRNMCPMRSHRRRF